MKISIKSVFGFALAGMLMLCLATTAQAQRGRIGMRGGLRVGVGFGGPRLGFGMGFMPFYTHPRAGFYINTLPYGYYPFYYGSDMYYYWGGNFYRPYNNGYQVAAPPIGAAVPSLPRAANPITIDGQQYFEAGGVYYKEGVDENGKRVFVVAGKDGVLQTDNSNAPADTADMDSLPTKQYLPHVGDVVSRLPEDTRKVTLNGRKYYIAPDDVYYEEIKDANGNTSYRIARVPEDDEVEHSTPSLKQEQPAKHGNDF